MLAEATLPFASLYPFEEFGCQDKGCNNVVMNGTTLENLEILQGNF